MFIFCCWIFWLVCGFVVVEASSFVLFAKICDSRCLAFTLSWYTFIAWRFRRTTAAEILTGLSSWFSADLVGLVLFFLNLNDDLVSLPCRNFSL